VAPLPPVASAAPIIVTAMMGAADFAWADGLRRAHFPPERNVLSAHISLFHHLPPSCLPELTQLVKAQAQGPRPIARCDRLISLGRGVAVHVESTELLTLRSRIAERFEDCLVPQDRAKPRLHITVQNKVSTAEARQTLEALAVGFRARPLAITGLSLWYYRGGPWELIQTTNFRGH
jgi:hypothetical protein